MPEQFKEILPQFKSIIFADVCKFGQHPQAGIITSLQQDGLLPGANWQNVAASPTYNPLGNLVTLLSVTKPRKS